MMDTIKITANILIPGSKKDNTITNKDYIKINDGKKWKTLEVETAGYKPAELHIKLTNQQFLAMTSKHGCPQTFYDKKLWLKMNRRQRLEVHLQDICEHNKGISYNYEILN